MKRLGLACSTVLVFGFGAPAIAQVSVPLPGKRPAPNPAPPADTAQVPLPPTDSGPGQPAAPSGPPPVGQTSIQDIPIGRYGRPDINPYERDLEITVPLYFRNRVLGEIDVQLTFDDRFLIDSKSFLRLIDPLLNSDAKAATVERLKDKLTFTNTDIADLGISLEYDPSSLSIVVLKINPEQRTLEDVFDPPRLPEDPVDLQPAHFSAYLNINAQQSYNWKGENGAPTVGINGATRIGKIVFEGDGQFSDPSTFGGGTGSYRFDRTYVRAVYDDPKRYRRWFIGDLTPEFRGQQSYVQMGGIGIARQRRTFDQNRSSVLQGDRQLILQRDSSVRVLRNGVLYREFQLQSGAYDLSSLPLVVGSNDIEIEVRDASGYVQIMNYGRYYDPIDLEPGDYEYAAYVGKLSSKFGLSPHYSGQVAFSGYFRKAFLDKPSIGLGLQLSESVQALTGQTQFVVGNGGRIMVDGGVSNTHNYGQGFALGISFDLAVDRGGLTDNFGLRADYRSQRFSGLGDTEPDNSTAATFNLQYTRAFTRQFTVLFGASYTKSRRDDGDSYRIQTSLNYYLSRKVSIRAGVDYTKYPGSFSRGNGFGVMVSLVWQPDYRQRAEGRYDSGNESTSLSYTRASSNKIGSFGFGAVLSRDFGSVNGQGYAEYTGNRFDATISHASYGPDFARFGDMNVSSVRVGTTLAFADGSFGIGRRINDSFAVLVPHSTLKGRSVVAGQSLAESEYISKSGFFGGAVNNLLNSYVTQSMQYDVEDPPAGYDVGQGVVRVKPPYRSGYKLRIGTDAFASAMGTLVDGRGSPMSLVSGRIYDTANPSAAPQAFFTNSVGRFAIPNLRPGVRYRVELFGSSAIFEFDVPKDTSGLVDLKLVRLASANKEKP